MENQSFGDEFQRYTNVMWHWAWLLAICTLAASLVSYLVSVRITPTYQASSKVLINEAPATRATDYASVLTSERLAQTYAELLTTLPVVQGTIEALDLPYTTDELARRLQVQPVRDTQLIVVEAEDTDAKRAADIVNTLVTVLIEQNRIMQEERFAASKTSLSRQMEEMNVRIQSTYELLEPLSESGEDLVERTRLETNLSQYRQIYSNLLLSYEQVRLSEAQTISSLVQVDPAIAPTLPVRPSVLRNTVLAALAGLMLSLAAVFLVEALDDTVKGPDEVSRALGLPVLGTIGAHTQDVRLVAAMEPRSPVAEAFRSLRTNLQFASVGKPLHSFIVTSPSPSDGKSTVASNLGIVLAQGGSRVVLLDGDLRRPNVHNVMGLPNRRGMSGLFVMPDVHINTWLHQSSVENLRVLPAGEIPPNPSELLGSGRMIEILGQLQDSSDIVIVDTPPVMAVTDAAALAPRVDGVLIVLRPGVTNLGAARQAVEQLRRVGANLLGVVLNQVDAGRMRYRYYHYHGAYHNYHGYYDESNHKRS